MPQLTSEIARAVAHRRRVVVLLPARRSAGAATGAERQLARLARPLRVAAAVRGAGADRRPVRHAATWGHCSSPVTAPARSSPRRSRCGGTSAAARTRTAFALAMALFVALDRRDHARALRARLAATTSPPRRLENLAAPLASANDQLALVTWFQRAAPPGGLRHRRRSVVRPRERDGAARACRRRSRATTRSRRSSACSAGPSRGR